MTRGCAGTAISRGGVRWVLGAHLGSGSLTFAVELTRWVVAWLGMANEGVLGRQLAELGSGGCWVLTWAPDLSRLLSNCRVWW